MNAVVAERGRVTIPKPLRDRLGLTPHTVLEFTAENGRLIGVKRNPADPVSRVRGCLKPARRSDELLRELRDVEPA